MAPKSTLSQSTDIPFQLEDKPATSHRQYQQFVNNLCLRNPSLQALSTVLAKPYSQTHSCKIFALDFGDGSISPDIRKIKDTDHLVSEFSRGKESDQKSSNTSTDHQLHGRLLIIEDLTVEVVVALGTELDIDPLFLAKHIHTAHRTGMQHQTPDDATLPSRLPESDYVNISYHEPVVCSNTFPSGAKFVTNAAIKRKLVFLRGTGIGLAQHRASVIKVARKDRFWLGEYLIPKRTNLLIFEAILLVDPPLGNNFLLSGEREDAGQETALDLKPFLGGCEDFVRPLPFSEVFKSLETPRQGDIASELIKNWTYSTPGSFDSVDPTIQSLAYYALRHVAAQWVKYIAVMQHCLKIYEYEGSRMDLEKLDMDLRELQGWRRRSMGSQQKIRAVMRHLKADKSTGTEVRDDLSLVLEDFEVISKDIEDTGRRLETMLPVVTSLVQIIDARQSFAETANISRLTVLALIFVPLSYVSSLFSMNTSNMPGSPYFWVYFAVAIPVTLVVVIIARPPTKTELRRSFAKARTTVAEWRQQARSATVYERRQSFA